MQLYLRKVMPFLWSILLALLCWGWAGTVMADSAWRREKLQAVHSWLYLIGIQELTDDTITRICDSDYDMVVLDFIPSEAESTDFPIGDVIARLHAARHPKLVLAYIDIGQAESYRTYWQPEWRIGNPAWIVGADPDGWAENYPVAFWHDEWQQIWLARGGMLDKILSAGFDGIYLDWIEAYSDEHVAAMAEQDGVDAKAAMIRWIQAIAGHCRQWSDNFLVIGQNAAELLADDNYFATLDALAQEQIWFDGGADNDPPGDCPLPATVAAVDSEDYVNSLSPECRRQHDAYPDSTLHMSSEEYLRDILPARQKGLPVFTVDYALDPRNIARIYTLSRSYGFVPFAGNRTLNTFVPVHAAERDDTAVMIVEGNGGESVQNPVFGPDNILFYTLFHQGYNQGPAGIYRLDAQETKTALLDENGNDSVNLPGASWNSITNRLVFASDRGGTDEIWSMNRDGGDLRQITTGTATGYNIEPSFSPDGQWIVFERDTLEQDDSRQQGSIFKIRADGSGLTRLTDGPGTGVDDRQPNWSPTGDRILFQRRVPGADNWDIYTMRPDGSDVRQITKTEASDTDAGFSPDGNWIVYSSDYGGLSVPNIFIQPVTGATPIRITKSQVNEDGAPSWSSDGRWIAFESHPGADEDTNASLWKISFAAPGPKIFFDGGDREYRVEQGENLQMHLALESGSMDAVDVDWWLVRIDAAGRTEYFDLAAGRFVPGLHVTCQGALSSFSDFVVSAFFGAEGPETYKVYFGVDMVKNGQLDMPALFYDHVTVHITTGEE